MKILIIEDDMDKSAKIITFLKQEFIDNLEIQERHSLRSGLKELIQGESYDLILLDMSMPSFDVNHDEPTGGTPKSFAGRELMAQMILRGIEIPVIVVTQYSSFEEGRVTLDGLRLEFEDKFGTFFLGAVYYNSTSDCWKQELLSYIQKVDKG